ncbi:uncharacterized protein LOC144449346 [Glandiceps talaboti]
MASDVDIVRVTESQLREIADKLADQRPKSALKEDKMQKTGDEKNGKGNDGRKRREPRRPAMTFYQPGVTRLTRRGDSTTSVDSKVKAEQGATKRDDVDKTDRYSEDDVNSQVYENVTIRSPTSPTITSPRSPTSPTITSPRSPTSPKEESRNRKQNIKSKKPDRVVYTVRNRVQKTREQEEGEGEGEEEGFKKERGTNCFQ